MEGMKHGGKKGKKEGRKEERKEGRKELIVTVNLFCALHKKGRSIALVTIKITNE